MSQEIKFICPYHEKTESIDLPDSYSLSFEGEVPCGGPDGERARLNLKLENGQVKEVRLQQAPPAY